MTSLDAGAHPRRDADATRWERSEDLLCVLGRDLVLRAANPAWGRVLGRPPYEFVGAHVFEWVHPDDARSLLERLPAAADRFTDLPCRLRDAGGRWRWFLWSGVRRDTAWDCTLVACAVRDTTRDVAERERVREEHHLARTSRIAIGSSRLSPR
jgi:PAS domain S-box-containing protein